MIKQTPGKIYLADQRGEAGTTQFRRYCTFNFEDYQQEHKEPFGSLEVFNEEMLAGSGNITLTVDKDSHVILMPITGALTLNTTHGGTNTIDVEEILINTLPAKSTIHLTNSYQSDVISFLQIRLKASRPIITNSWLLSNFELNAGKNQLMPIVLPEKEQRVLHQFPFYLSIGQFDGRQEAIYRLKNKSNGFFAFVVAGAFEVEGRLLHEKDGLALWNTEEVELEALSPNALIVVIEFEIGE